ncbi:7746_t:CDS:2, partial [Scutellospora calospora]
TRDLKSLVCKKAYIKEKTEIINPNQEEQRIHQEDHSLVIRLQKICATVNKAFNFELETREETIKICHVKLASPKDVEELFLLKNYIDITSFQSLPQ